MVRFMIHPGQVKQSVQYQNAQFGFDAMPELNGLRPCAVERNREFIG